MIDISNYQFFEYENVADTCSVSRYCSNFLNIEEPHGVAWKDTIDRGIRDLNWLVKMCFELPFRICIIILAPLDFSATLTRWSRVKDKKFFGQR